MQIYDIEMYGKCSCKTQVNSMERFWAFFSSRQSTFSDNDDNSDNNDKINDA